MAPGPLPVVLLMGPTASGKTGLSLALAARLPLEIVSVDSAQVYRGLDIGAAKPDAATRAAVPHHLIDICDPAETYSAARFHDDALAKIAEIRGRGKIPLLCGGTMLYYRALQRGLSELPPASAEFRGRLEARARAHGWGALHEELAKVDPESAARLHPNDAQRIQRALEIHALTGMPASRLRDGGTARLEGPVLKYALNPPQRSVLHERIRARLAAMMAAGFLDEVAGLRARGDLHPQLPSMRAVGYRQLWAHLDGECALPEAFERAVAATRQFAKRQLTWLRSEPGLTWLNPDDPACLQTVTEGIENHEAATK